MRKTKESLQNLCGMMWHSDRWNKRIIDLFGLKVFSTPKPVSFIEKIIELGTTGNDIVLDFFSGSATTAHAVLQHNALQNTQCKYI